MKHYITAGLLLPLLAICFLTSCASIPKETPAQPVHLSRLHRVLVAVSSDDLKVKRASERTVGPSEMFVGVLFPLPFLAVETIDWGVGRAADSSPWKALEPSGSRETIAQRMSAYFRQALADSKAFEVVQEMPAETADAPTRTFARNFDGVVKLRITEIALRKVNNYELALFVTVTAEMASLSEGRERSLLWRRQEKLTSEEAQPLDFYKAHGIPALDTCLARLARRLADDLAYSQ